jgi:hypothetical protein
MTNVNWQHLILAASSSYTGTSRRVARMRLGGAVFPPPIRSGNWSGDGAWSPTTNVRGRAPEAYLPPHPAGTEEFYGERRYVFAFWSVAGSSPTGTPLLEVYTDMTPAPGGGPWDLQAKAWYVWDYGTGSGPHAIEVDAFSRTDNNFIPDFFVDVSPDGPPTPGDPEAGGSLSRIANYDGYVITDTLANPVEIRARELIGDGLLRYRFSHWVAVTSLTSGQPRPTVDGDRITAHRSNIMRAFAIYDRDPVAPPTIQQVTLPRFGGIILGPAPAGQPYIIIPFGGGPKPVGGDDPPLFRQIWAGLRGLVKRLVGAFK